MTNPESVLDIGVGFGKYGLLTREYTDIYAGRLEKESEWQVRIDGIEAHGRYINPAHRFIYDDIFVGDALEILPGLQRSYDLIILVDVLEHFTRDDGMKILSECGKKGRNIIISVPTLWYDQVALFENEYEIHRSHWHKEDLKMLKDIFFVKNKIALIGYAGEKARAISVELRRLRLSPYRNFLSSILEVLHIKEPLKKLLGR